MMNSLPTLNQQRPDKKIDKFLLLKDFKLEDVKKELEDVLEDKCEITELKEKGTVATYQVVYPYHKMYNLRGRIFKRVEFIFNDYDFYSLRTTSGIVELNGYKR